MIVSIYKVIEAIKNSPARKSRLLWITNILAILINLGTWLFTYFEFQTILQRNPGVTEFWLHYNIYWGTDKFGNWKQIFLIPITGVAIIIINLILSIFIYSKKEILSYFLAIASTFTQIFLFLACLLIILQNL